MSDVIRDAIIRIRYETQKAKLESPELSATVKAHEKVAAAADKVAQSHKEIASSTERAAVAHEEFGRRSFTAFAHAGHGVLQLTRGMALLGASGEEDTKKVLENLLKIEAGVSIAKGSASLLKFAGEFGTLGVAVAGAGAIVAAGATIWSHYRSEVVKIEEALKKVVEAQKAAAEAERKMQHEQAQNQSRGMAAQTDAEFDPAKRMDARNAEWKKRHAALSERLEQGGNIEKAIEEAEAKARKAESVATRFDQDPAMAGYYAFQAGFASKEEATKEAERQKKIAGDHRKQLQSSLELDVADVERQQELIGQQNSDKVSSIRQGEQTQLQAMRDADSSMSPMAKAQREADDLKANIQREKFNTAMGAAPVGVGAFGVFGGAAVASMQTATPQQLREAGIHAKANADVDKVNNESTKAVKQVAELLTKLNDELAKLKNAHPN